MRKIEPALINEASKETDFIVAKEILNRIKDRDALSRQFYYLNVLDREHIKRALTAKGISIRMPSWVPGPTKPFSLGQTIKMAKEDKSRNEYYFDGSSFVYGDKTILSMNAKTTISDLLDAAKLKL